MFKIQIFLARLRIVEDSYIFSWVKNIYPKLSPYFYTFFARSSGGKLQLPDEYLALDGNSLATDDLLQLGKGMYKVGTTRDVAVGVQNIEIK